MSRCPDARKCETLFAPSLIRLSSIINFTVSYIAHGSTPNDIQCMHGEDECLGINNNYVYRICVHKQL